MVALWSCRTEKGKIGPGIAKLTSVARLCHTVDTGAAGGRVLRFVCDNLRNLASKRFEFKVEGNFATDARR